MKVTINGKTYRDWQLSFHDGHYRLLASMEENGIMTSAYASDPYTLLRTFSFMAPGNTKITVIEE